MGTKVVIFDMDGVIADTQGIHSEAEELALKEHGIEINSADLTKEYAGMPQRDCAEMIFRKYEKDVDVDKYVEQKWFKVLETAKGKIRAVEGALDLIKNLKENNFKLAVASTSIPEFINLVLSELEIKDNFAILTSGQEVEFGKPNPEIFLLTAKRLAVSPSECVVIEDAEHGVVAAKKAGMKCVWLTGQDSPEKKECPADIVVKSLKQLQLKDFL